MPLHVGHVSDTVRLAGCGKRVWPGLPGRDPLCGGSDGDGVADARAGSADGRSIQLRQLREPGAAGHPLRTILPVAAAALAALSGDFQQLYALNGWPSIVPEKLLRGVVRLARVALTWQAAGHDEDA